MKIDESKFEAAAERGYRRALDAAAALGEVAEVDTCRAAAAEDVLAELTADPLAVDLRRKFADGHAARVDRRLTEGGKKLLDAYIDGARPLGDLLDPVVVPLGEGQRCTFGELTLPRLLAARALRDQNMYAVINENQRYVGKVHDPIEKVLLRYGGTVREAWANGWLF